MRYDPIWRTWDGRVIPVSQMTGDHARNALATVLRNRKQNARRDFRYPSITPGLAIIMRQHAKLASQEDYPDYYRVERYIDDRVPWSEQQAFYQAVRAEQEPPLPRGWCQCHDCQAAYLRGFP